MAKFNAQFPDALTKAFQELSLDTEKMLGEMTRAGAKKAYDNVVSNLPSQLKDSDIMRCLIITETYKTPSDGGINNKVGFYGYFYSKPNKHGKVKKVPAPLVANLFEYGNSEETYPKKPFFRKSFKKKEIEATMALIQEKYIKGIFNE